MAQIGSAMMPNADQVIPFHIILSGKAWAKPENGSMAPEGVFAGDVVMFPSGDGHIITSDSEVWQGESPDLDFYYKASVSDVPFTLVDIGDGGVKTKFVCGYLGCNAPPFNSLLRNLPPMLVIKRRGDQSGLMKELIQTALEEKSTGEAGAETVIAKLSELLLINALRQYMSEQTVVDTRNLLTGLQDQHVYKALELIHSNPSRKWTLAILSTECGMSRSAFSERFSRYVGESPMRYIGRWRMELAANSILNGSSIGEVFDQWGYSSEAAFQKAFKKQIGMSVGKWRNKAMSSNVTNSTERGLANKLGLP